MDKPAKRRPSIYIVNLQWTPKDCQAIIKINGKCDIVMEKLMKHLAITVPKYSRNSDPIIEHATDLCKEEQHTANRPFLTNIKTESIDFKEIKVEKCVNEGNNEVFDCSAISEENIKKEKIESCVTSCKKEVLIDTGQGENVNYIKKELIVITIKSGDDFKDCCPLFKDNQNHDCDCPNFIDEQNDIPVIIENDDALVLNNSEDSLVKKNKLKTCNVSVTNPGKEKIKNNSVPNNNNKIGKKNIYILYIFFLLHQHFNTAKQTRKVF